MKLVADWNSTERLRAEQLARSILHGVGHDAEQHIETTPHAYHLRRVMTEHERGTLPQHPDRKDRA